ncbi:MAG: PIG-L family deacetylase [Deltaproteobacteria bacterium]|nr:PIG-L family deacetylase [Deltaproteobacteria bacterium]
MPTIGSSYVPKSAMAIFAHPDDADFTVAGTIAKWAKAGCEVTLVLITSGNAGTHDPKYTRDTLARTRETEQREAARILGVKDVVFLGHNDCELQPTIDVRRDLVREIRRFRPEVVICGDPQSWFFEDRYINHPDHRAAGAAALDAVSPCAEMELLWPEVGPPHKVQAVFVAMTFFPNVWIDVTDTIDTKILALRAHASQMGGWDPAGMIREWGRREAERAGWASGGGTGDASAVRYAEGFRVVWFRER